MNTIPQFEKALFSQFIESNKRVPKVREFFQDFPIGKWYKEKKHLVASDNDIFYEQLNINDKVKKDLDKHLSIKKNKITMTSEEAKALTIQFTQEKLPSLIYLLKNKIHVNGFQTDSQTTDDIIQFLEENLETYFIANYNKL